MKNRSKAESGSRAPADDIKPEYRFNYADAKPNRFVRRGSRESVIVVLDSDVAQVFRDAESVNSALRAILSALPQTVKRSSNKS